MSEVIDLERAYKIAKELKWRVWPEEKPIDPCCDECPTICLIRTDDSVPLQYAISLGEYRNKHGWNTSGDFIEPENGDKWLPLSSLKVLDE